MEVYATREIVEDGVATNLLDAFTDPYNSNQYSLPFIVDLEIYLPSDVAQFSSYISRSYLPIMHLSFCSFVSRQPRLRRMATELNHQGIVKVRDVIMKSPEEIVALTSATQREMDCLERFLADGELRLQLGARILGWSEANAGPACRGR